MFTPKYDHRGEMTGWANLDRADHLSFRDLNSGMVAVEAYGGDRNLGAIVIADDRADATEQVRSMMVGHNLLLPAPLRTQVFSDVQSAREDAAMGIPVMDSPKGRVK